MQNEEMQSLAISFCSSFGIHHSAFCISSIAGIRFTYSQSLPYVILLLGFLSVLILFVYPAQLRQVPRRVRWLLPGLRLLGVSVLALSILRPVMTRPRASGERASVMIVLDNSASMGVSDINRQPAEWVGIAAAMGMLPADVRDKQLDAVQAGCDRLSTQADEVTRARAEVDYARLSGRGVEVAQTRLDQAVEALQAGARETRNAAAVVKAVDLDHVLSSLVQLPGVDKTAWLDHLRDNARTAAADAEKARLASDAELFRSDQKVRDACRPLQSLSRLQLEKLMVFKPASGLLSRLGVGTAAGSAVLVYGVSDRVTPIDVSAPQDDDPPLTADGSASNLTGGLRAVLDSLKESPPRAVVLFSDGRLTGAEMDAGTLAALQAVPIFAVGVASRSGLKDLSIISAAVPSAASLGETVTLTAELKSFGMRGISTSVTVTGGGDDETRPITFHDDRAIGVTFSRHFTTPGLQRLTLEIQAVPGELSYENNRIERWVNVSATPGKSSQPAQPATRPVREAEMADLSGNEVALRQLAESSGGQFLRLDQVNLLPKRLDEVRDNLSRPIEIPLWDGLYLYVLVLGSLTAEWGLRKRYGLV